MAYKLFSCFDYIKARFGFFGGFDEEVYSYKVILLAGFGDNNSNCIAKPHCIRNFNDGYDYAG